MLLNLALRVSPLVSIERLQGLPTRVAGWLLVAVGGLGVWLCPVSVGLRFSEALLIAGVLSLTVDLYLKRKLQVEAAKDIFHHLLGIDLPLEVRNALQESLLKTKIYAIDTVIDVRITQDTNSTHLGISLSSVVVAAADTKYRQPLSFEAAEHGKIMQVAVTSDTHPSVNYSIDNPLMNENADLWGVLEWKGKEIKLSKGERLRAYSKFSVEINGLDGFWILNFSRPTINARLRFHADPGIRVGGGSPKELTGNEYSYQKVFVPGDHITLYWRREAS